MFFSPLLGKLITALRCLPGIGPKSAQRMALHILERDRQGGYTLAKALEEALSLVGNCQRCRILSELTLCNVCASPKRDNNLLCIVETPADAMAIEQTASYYGYYFVLMGYLSPIDGIGPAELGIEQLVANLKKYLPKEVILATNLTVEGEATAHYLAELIKAYHINTSRIAYGVPLGGELEFIDTNTLARALTARASV